MLSAYAVVRKNSVFVRHFQSGWLIFVISSSSSPILRYDEVPSQLFYHTVNQFLLVNTNFINSVLTVESFDFDVFSTTCSIVLIPYFSELLGQVRINLTLVENVFIMCIALERMLLGILVCFNVTTYYRWFYHLWSLRNLANSAFEWAISDSHSDESESLILIHRRRRWFWG